MSDTPSAILLLRLMSTGSQVNLWGSYLNVLFQTTERASKGYQALAVTGSATVSWSNYSASNDGSVAFLKLTGALSSAVTLTFPSLQHYVSMWNATGAAVTIKCSGGTGVTIPNGVRTLLYCDGVDYFSAASNWMNSASSLANNGDIPNYAQLVAYVAAAISAASTSVSGLMSRYIYTAAGGETSKSGADDNGNTLAYTPGSEIVSLNGVQLVRNIDYTAANGTSISGLSALAANDELMIAALAAVSVPNAFSITNNLSEGTPATMRTNLGLGTAAVKNTGTSGANVPLMNGANTWSGVQAFSAIPSLTGGGVLFPATQVPSSDPNTLDDYEEGTWTPILTPGGGTFTSASAIGTYTKIGRVWYITITVTITTAGSATGGVSATLPSAATVVSCLSGRETAVTGSALTGTIPVGSSVSILTYNNGSPINSGASLTLTGWFL